MITSKPSSPFLNAVSPLKEMAAYEALWRHKGSSFKTIAEKFRGTDALPSDMVTITEIEQAIVKLQELTKNTNLGSFGVRIHGTRDYPDKLRDARHPLEILYYQGWWDLVNTRCVAVVGARNVSDDGVKRAKKLATLLVKAGFTVVSGLAKGVDTVAHHTAIDSGGKTIAVIGTPLTHTYPKENGELQNIIRRDHLLISQVPFWDYTLKDYRWNRSHFPERNVTMSALSEATVIVEASDTSGTLHQAKAAIHQGRKLFILDSCFRNPTISWPQNFEKQGAIRVTDINDIVENLR